MNNQPRKINLNGKNSKECRTIHLITKTKQKSFKFASVNCKQWVLNNGFPFRIRVSYGIHKTVFGKLEEFTNEMYCKSNEDFLLALQAFIKEYYE